MKKILSIILVVATTISLASAQTIWNLNTNEIKQANNNYYLNLDSDCQNMFRINYDIASTSEFRYQSFYLDGSMKWDIVSRNGSTDQTKYLSFRSYTGTTPTHVLFMQENGNIGMGTINATHKLTVNGTIKAEEIIVDDVTTADFVFDDDYQLKSLTEVEKFINENNHLPDIPSADEMVQNGVSINEMQGKLLQKIEELTLYMIELKKENEYLKAQIEKE